MSFKGKVVIVTGASSGIGAATAAAFAGAGASVVMVGRNTTKLNRVAALAEQKGGRPLVIAGDVSVHKDCKKVVEETLKAFKKIDILVNNAGIFDEAGILDSNAMEAYDSVMATNLFGVVYLTNLAAPHLVESKGNIVNVSSIAGMGISVPKSFAYLTSKAGLDHFSRAIALELAPKGVRVNTVNPGLVPSIIAKSGKITSEQIDAVVEHIGKQYPLGKYGEPEEIADLITFLASDNARSITGSNYVSDNGAMLIGCMKTF